VVQAYRGNRRAGRLAQLGVPVSAATATERAGGGRELALSMPTAAADRAAARQADAGELSNLPYFGTTSPPAPNLRGGVYSMPKAVLMWFATATKRLSLAACSPPFQGAGRTCTRSKAVGVSAACTGLALEQGNGSIIAIALMLMSLLLRVGCRQPCASSRLCLRVAHRRPLLSASDSRLTPRPSKH